MPPAARGQKLRLEGGGFGDQWGGGMADQTNVDDGGQGL